MRAALAKTVRVVDEGSLASTHQARDLLRIAGALRVPKLVLVGDAKQLDAVDAGKPFARLQADGMKTAAMDEILRQRDPDLKAAVEASLTGEIGKAFDKLGPNVAEVKADNIAGAVAARWLRLSPEERERPGVMAPSHALREGINANIRERLVREGRIAGPAMETACLVSRGYTNAKKLSPRTTRGAMSSRFTVPAGASASPGAMSAASPASTAGREPSCSKRRAAGPSPGSRPRSAGGGAERRSAAARASSFARATASAGPATTRVPGWSTAAMPNCPASAMAG